MVSYLTVIPFLLYVLYFLVNKRIIIKVADTVNYIFILLYSMTAIGEACLYREWKAKLSVQALQHFTHPSEVFRTTSIGLTVLFFSMVIITSWLCIRIYNRRISLLKLHPIDTSHFGKYRWKVLVFFIIGIAFLGISFRGGVQQIPIQSSDAFFCIEPTVNDTAVNPMWNLMYNIADYEINFSENPYHDFEIAQANAIVKSLFKTDKDTTNIFLKTKKPNIVFIILEGWSAYDIKSFGGDDFAPFTGSLSRQGIRFSKFYPAGYVSDQGVPAVLSSYPAVSRIAVINQSSKSVPLPCINQDLAKQGYQSGFMFGGDLNYGNIKSYIYNKKFDVVKEEKDIDASVRRGALGIQDADMQAQYLKMINAAKPPFVYVWFSLSTHMPYDYIGEKKQLTKLENDYTNSVTYADKALQSFFAEAKKQSWYANTLFVITSDHSHGCHRDFSAYDPEYHRTPLIFFGDVIDSTYRGMEVKTVNSQLDIIKTIEKQMGLNDESNQYVWGKDMFNPYSRKFAYFCSFDGGGFITDDGFISYQHKVNALVFNSFAKDNHQADTLANYGRAFQEAVYQDYMEK
jgi:phosphoglycerol transferase MdoB-like AlkP superfamily enzyme